MRSSSSYGGRHLSRDLVCMVQARESGHKSGVNYRNRWDGREDLGFFVLCYDSSVPS